MAANLEKSQSWIVDSRASNHMTGDKSIFHRLLACGNSPHVRIADGTLSKVMGIGTVIASKNLTLHSVLYLPKLNCNLLSVSKLIKDMDCVAKFRSNTCVF